jgi:hypothetical protein
MFIFKLVGIQAMGTRCADHMTPPLSSNVGTNFANKRRLIGRYISPFRLKATEFVFYVSGLEYFSSSDKEIFQDTTLRIVFHMQNIMEKILLPKAHILG